MKLDRRAGWALVVSNEAIRRVQFTVADIGHPCFLSRQNGLVQFAYSELADVYFLQEDDTDEWGAAIHVLAVSDLGIDIPDGDRFAIPSKAEIEAGLDAALLLVSEAVKSGDIHPDEADRQMAFSRSLIGTPASIYAEWSLIGDVAQAQASLIRKDLSMHDEFVADIRSISEEDR